MGNINDQDLLYDVSKKVLAVSGLTIDDVDVLIDAGSDVLDGRGISTYTLVDSMGGGMKDEAKVAEDGIYAALYAYMKIASGMFDCAMVVAYGKSSECPLHYQAEIMFDPFYARPLSLDFISSAALQCSSYMDKYGISEEQIAKVAVKNRRNAIYNPAAQLRMDSTVEDVLGSEMLMSPIRKMEACPISDGACAVIMASEKVANEMDISPAWILGVGQSSDVLYPGYRDLSYLKSAEVAANSAYRMAGINDPLEELGVAEVSEQFAHQELMLYEALGFCEPGKGGELIDSGLTELEGKLPVNPSGGALCANPILATGLVRLREASLQVTGAAGARQVKGVGKALAHGTIGVAAQSNCVFILGSE